MKFVSHVFPNSAGIAIDPCERKSVLKGVIEALARDPKIILDAPKFPTEYDINVLHAGRYVLNDGDLLDLCFMMKQEGMCVVSTFTKEERLKSEEYQQQIYTKLRTAMKKLFPSAFTKK